MNQDKNKKTKDTNAFFSYKIPQTKKVLILETNFAISVFLGEILFSPINYPPTPSRRRRGVSLTLKKNILTSTLPHSYSILGVKLKFP